jgi:hypothetical protein
VDHARRFHPLSYQIGYCKESRLVGPNLSSQKKHRALYFKSFRLVAPNYSSAWRLVARKHCMLWLRKNSTKTKRLKQSIPAKKWNTASRASSAFRTSGGLFVGERRTTLPKQTPAKTNSGTLNRKPLSRRSIRRYKPRTQANARYSYARPPSKYYWNRRPQVSEVLTNFRHTARSFCPSNEQWSASANKKPIQPELLAYISPPRLGGNVTNTRSNDAAYRCSLYHYVFNR